MTIHPRDGRPPREIVALRCFVTKDDKPLYPDYWDCTAQTLVPQLLPYLEAAGGGPVRFKITKFGQGPTARFSVVKQA